MARPLSVGCIEPAGKCPTGRQPGTRELNLADGLPPMQPPRALSSAGSSKSRRKAWMATRYFGMGIRNVICNGRALPAHRWVACRQKLDGGGRFQLISIISHTISYRSRTYTTRRHEIPPFLLRGFAPSSRTFSSPRRCGGPSSNPLHSFNRHHSR